MRYPPWQLVALGGAALAVWYFSRKAADTAAGAAQAVADAVNPVSDRNLAYRGVNSIGGVIAGVPSWSFGSQIYDWTHPNENPVAPAAPANEMIKNASAPVFDAGLGKGW